MKKTKQIWPKLITVHITNSASNETTSISASYLVFYTVAVLYSNCVNCHTAESSILVGTVRAVRVAVTDEAGVGTVAVLTLELANGAITGRAGLRFIWAITTIRLAVTLPPNRNTPEDERKHKKVILENFH